MKYYKNIAINKFSYVNVGGIVKKLYIASTTEDIINVSTFEKKVRIIGQGSKILFAFHYDDSTYIIDRNDYIKEENDYVEIGSGTPLNKIGIYFENNDLDGFSKLRSIPGRLGGSIVQNASCYNQCISDYLIDVKVVLNNKVITKNKEDLAFSYRNSIFKIIPYIILSARFKKVNKSKLLLSEETNKILLFRKEKQPIDKLTFGSTFVNFDGYIVSKILDDLHLKGFHLNSGVKVSEKHANFLEIEKDCSYEQIMLLLHSLTSVLYKRMGVFFPLEIVIFRENYFGNQNTV